MVDDSIVRGNTAGPLVQLLRDAGAARCMCAWRARPFDFPVSWASTWRRRASSSPPTSSLDEIREHIGADSLAFLSLDAMMKALHADDGYCNACFTGEYPFDNTNSIN